MKNKKLKCGIYVFIIILLIIVVISTHTNLELKSMIDNNQYYEAFKLIHNNKLLLGVSNNSNNLSIQFFKAMAYHTQYTGNSTDDWILPDMTDWSCAEVASALKNIGQPYEVKFIDSPESGHNVVVKQVPVAESKVTTDEIITLFANGYYGGNPQFLRVGYPGSHKIVESGEYVYYIDRSKMNLYKSHIDFSDAEIIYSSTEYELMNVIAKQDKVYLIQRNSELEYELIVLSLTDCTKSTLYESQGVAWSFVVDDKLFFWDWQIYSMDLASGKIKTTDFSEKDEERLYKRGYVALYSDEELALYYAYLTDENANKTTLHKQYLERENNQILMDIENRIEDMVVIDKYIFIKGKKYTVGNIENGYQYVYMYNLETYEKEEIYVDESEDDSNINILQWKNHVVIVDANDKSVMYDIDSEKTNTLNIEINKLEDNLLSNYYPNSSDAIICGNYIFFTNDYKEDRFYRYNILTSCME